MPVLTNLQIDALKALKRSPKTTAKAHEVLLTKNRYATRASVHKLMRRLENREFIRAREIFNKKLKRSVIVWELTEKGRNALI